MSLATDIQDDLAELLDDPDYGRKVVVRRDVAGAYSPSTGATAASTSTSNATRGLLLSYKDYLVDGSLIKQGDRKCILKTKAMTMVPKSEDLIDVYNAAGAEITETLRVVSVKRGELSGVDFLYVLQVRT